LRVAVLNDFEAAGYGITIISEKDYVVLNDMPAAPQASSSLGPTFGLQIVNQEAHLLHAFMPECLPTSKVCVPVVLSVTIDKLGPDLRACSPRLV